MAKAPANNGKPITKEDLTLLKKLAIHLRVLWLTNYREVKVLYTI